MKETQWYNSGYSSICGWWITSYSVLTPQQRKDQNLSASGILISAVRKTLGRFPVEAIGGPGSLGMVWHALAITSHILCGHFLMTFKLSFWCNFLSWILKLALQIWLALHVVLSTFQKTMYRGSAFWFSTSQPKFDCRTSLCHCYPFYHKSQFLSSISQKPVCIAGKKTPCFCTLRTTHDIVFSTITDSKSVICLPQQVDYHISLHHIAPAITKYSVGSLSSIALPIF